MPHHRSNAISTLAVLIVSTACVSGVPSLAQNTSRPVDNSSQNSNQPVIADKQNNNSSDLATTAQVRRALMHDRDLSTYAHNVKILVADGAVTLKGPVNSDAEKARVAADAASVVSPDKITNELTVKQ